MEKKGKQKKLLVTGIGGDIGQSILRCAKDFASPVSIIGCDIDRYAASRQEVDIFHESPLAGNADKYIAFLKGIVESERIDYIIPTTEPEIFILNQRRAELDDKCTLVINSSNIINTFLDKYATVEFFKNKGLPFPRTYLTENYSGGLDFPLLLKQRSGCGREGLAIVHDSEELDFFRKRRKNSIIQEVIGDIDEEYTIGVFSNGSRVYSIAFKRTLGYGSLSKIAELVNNEAIFDLAQKIACAIALRGSINIQVRKTERGFVPFEINPRFSSTVYIRHYFGFRDVEWWLNLFENTPIVYTPKYTSGVGVRRLNEIFFECEPSPG
jgi:carbamoyl-phosphate synthase large subunit